MPQLEYTLPDQPPADGAIEIIPLGGDGFSSPQSAYGFALRLAGDNSADNTIDVSIAFDVQYATLVQYVSWSWKPGSTNEDQGWVRASLRSRRGGEVSQQNFLYNHSQTINSNVVDDFGNNGTWNPPGVISTIDQVPADYLDRPRVTVNCPNQSSTDELVVTGRVLNFNRRAREVVDLNVLLSVLPR